MERRGFRPDTGTGADRIKELKRAVARGKLEARYRNSVSLSALLAQDAAKPVGGIAAAEAKDESRPDPGHYDILNADLALTAKGGKKNGSRAIPLYQTAVTKGSVKALRRLGYCYMTGSGAPRDITKAMDYYLSAMKQGDEVSAIEYCIALQNASSGLRARLEAVGHDASNLSIARVDEKLAYRLAREREEERGRHAMIYYDGVTSWLQFILGCIVWFTAAPLWMKLALPVVIGLIGATVEVFAVVKPSRSHDGASVTCCYVFNALVMPVLWVIWVYFLKGIFAVGKWLVSFFL